LFRDGRVTWFRLISLVCLGAAIASDCHRNGYCELIYIIPSLITKEGFNTTLTNWILENGGWGGINDYIRKNTIEKNRFCLPPMSEPADDRDLTDIDLLDKCFATRVQENITIINDLPPRVKIAALIFILIMFILIW